MAIRDGVNVRWNHLVPFELNIPIARTFTASELGSIGTLNTKKFDIIKLRNVRIVSIESELKEFKHLNGASAGIDYNLFAKITKPNNEVPFGVALTSQVTSGATSLAKNSALRISPTKLDDYVIGGSTGGRTASAGYGATKPSATQTGTTAVNEANLSSAVSPDPIAPLSRKFPEIVIGFELGGGTVATGLELDTVITVVGFTVDKEINGGFPYSSYGSVLSFDSTAGNYTIATANIPADSAGYGDLRWDI